MQIRTYTLNLCEMGWPVPDYSSCLWEPVCKLIGIQVFQLQAVR